MKLGMAAIAAAMTISMPVSAAIITLKVSGTVTRKKMTDSIFRATEALTGTVQYDTSAVAYQTGPYENGTYAYFRPIGGSFLIHGLTYAFNSSGTFGLVDSDLGDAISFSQGYPTGAATGSYTPSYLALQFDGANLVSGNAAPQTTAPFLKASSRYFQLWFNGGYTEGLTGYVSLTSATITPEPASWLMMIAGFGAIGGVLRRRDRGPAPRLTAGTGGITSPA